jgi:hypothetical protein
MWEQSLGPIDQYRKKLEDVEKAAKSGRLAPGGKEKLTLTIQQELENDLIAEAEKKLQERKKMRIDLEMGTVGLLDFGQRVQDAINKNFAAKKEEQEIKNMVEEQKRANGIGTDGNNTLTLIHGELKRLNTGMGP